MPSEESYSQVEQALLMSTALTTPSAVYQDLLRKEVFTKPRLGPDKKDLLRHQKVLRNDESLGFLLIVWKESKFVSDEDLSRFDMQRTFTDGPLTVHKIATTLAPSAVDLGKVASQTRAIALAAEVYGLIERDGSRSTSKPLIATENLHQFILEFTRIYRELLAALGLSLNHPGNRSPDQ